MKAALRLGAGLCGALLAISIGPGVASGGDDTAGAGEQRNFIAFTRFNPVRDTLALFRARPDGSHRQHLTHGPAFFPDWSPDRTHLVFDFPDDEGNEQIGIVRADGTGFRQLTDLPGISEVPRFSPDGRTLVFGRSPVMPDEDPNFFTSLWVMDANGNDPHPLFRPDPDKFDVEPEFSPDGRRIVFARLRFAAGIQKAAIFTVRADGTGERRITRFTIGLEHPRWSPDGRRIIFDIELEEPSDPAGGIWQVGANGRNLRQVLPGSSELFGFKPVYSPNGQRILFGCFIVAQDQDDLCVMRADGSRVRNITRTPNIFENFPVWR